MRGSVPGGSLWIPRLMRWLRPARSACSRNTLPGRRRPGRDGWNADYPQPGNVLMVADLTRLGRSTADLADIETVLGQRGIGFRSMAEPWLDTTSAHGKLIFDMFASLAEYERSRLSERTKAELAAAKARGRRVARRGP